MPFDISRFLISGPSPGKRWRHEDASEMMFDDLVAKNNIYLPENDTRFIKALISGNPCGCSYVYRFFVHPVVFT